MKNGSNLLEVASEVDRYCSWPGQACGYKVGHSTINRLRDHAKAELGPKYDLKAFDDAVVKFAEAYANLAAQHIRMGRYEEAIGEISHAMAEYLEREHPKLVVSKMAKALRPGKVFVDRTNWDHVDRDPNGFIYR